MASTSDDQNKTVTGYPAPPGQVATGYPQFAPPVNSAYLYAAAPPPSTLYTTAPYYHNPLRRHAVLRCLIVAVLIVFFIVGFVYFVVWLVFRPRLPEFRVASASVTPIINSTASDLTANWYFTILVTNPNDKLAVFYERLDASVFYAHDFVLSQTQLTPFSQTKKNRTVINAWFAVIGANVGDDVVKAILGDRSRGSVRFGVKFLALLSFRSGGWRSRKHFMQVYCEGLNFGYSSRHGQGTLSNPSKECAVYL